MKLTNKEKVELYKFAVKLEELSKEENVTMKDITVSDYSGEISVTFSIKKDEDNVIVVT